MVGSWELLGYFDYFVSEGLAVARETHFYRLVLIRPHRELKVVRRTW